MKYVTTSRIIKSLTLGTVIVMSAASAANADDVNLKTMIPGVPQIDSEAYVLIDYNSGKVLAEMNADARRNPASLTKMMTSYVIGQAIKAGKIGPEDMVTVGKDLMGNWQSRIQRLFVDVFETRRPCTGF